MTKTNLFEIPNRKSYEQLIEENAGCFEKALNGYIRIYEEGEKRCECKDCQAIDKIKSDFDGICTRVPIDMFFTPMRRKGAIQLDSEAKFLENAQRSKNIQDMDNK